MIGESAIRESVLGESTIGVSVENAIGCVIGENAVP